MANIFQIAVERLVDIGFYNFLLPFILFSTVLYAVLRKTQILGDSPMIHGIISVIAGLFVFGMPVIIGADISLPLTSFLTQGAVVILVLVIGFLIASFFYPNIMEKLSEIFKPPGPGGAIVWIVVGTAAAVGLFSFAFKPISQLFKTLRVPSELGVMSGVIIVVFVVFLLITMSRGVEK